MKFSLTLLVLSFNSTVIFALPAPQLLGLEDARVLQEAIAFFVQGIAAPTNAAIAVNLQRIAHVEASILIESLQRTLITQFVKTAGTVISYITKIVTRPRLVLPVEDPAVMAEIVELRAQAEQLAEHLHAQLDPMVTAARALAIKTKPSSTKMTSEIRMVPHTPEDVEKALSAIKSPHSNPNIATSLDQTKSVINQLQEIERKLSEAKPILEKASNDAMELAREKSIVEVLTGVVMDLRVVGGTIFGAGGAAIVTTQVLKKSTPNVITSAVTPSPARKL